MAAFYLDSGNHQSETTLKSGNFGGFSVKGHQVDEPGVEVFEASATWLELHR
jgi:hypothetical protein